MSAPPVYPSEIPPPPPAHLPADRFNTDIEAQLTPARARASEDTLPAPYKRTESTHGDLPPYVPPRGRGAPDYGDVQRLDERAAVRQRLLGMHWWKQYAMVVFVVIVIVLISMLVTRLRS